MIFILRGFVNMIKHAAELEAVYMLRPDSQPLTRFEAGRPVSKRVS